MMLAEQTVQMGGLYLGETIRLWPAYELLPLSRDAKT
jgi:hypothetical protein